jgi:hypothetical protein
MHNDCAQFLILAQIIRKKENIFEGAVWVPKPELGNQK